VSTGSGTAGVAGITSARSTGVNPRVPPARNRTTSSARNASRSAAVVPTGTAAAWIRGAPASTHATFLATTTEVSTPVFDGTNLSWFTLAGRIDAVQFTDVELWTSPWSPDSALLTPGMVGRLDAPGPTRNIHTGGGYVVVSHDGTSRRIYRLADGYSAIMVTPPRTSFDHAGPDQFAFGPRGTVESPYGVPYLDFIRWDALTYEAP
jgi:hypothetical protein